MGNNQKNSSTPVTPPAQPPSPSTIIPAPPEQNSGKSYNWIGIITVAVCVALLLLYLAIRAQEANPTDQIKTDILNFLPYLFAGGISSVFAILDLYDKFPDFGLGLPLSNKYGLGYLLFSTITPMLLLYGYLNYFVPTLSFPKIGDEWTTAFVVALAFPLLIRSKFFSYTNSTGDNVAVGFDQLYDRLVGFFVREILVSSKSQEKREDLVTKCSQIFTLPELQNEAAKLILNHTDWKEDRQNREREKINAISSSQDTPEVKELRISGYILMTNGEDYLSYIMLKKAPTEEQEIKRVVDTYKAITGKSLKLMFTR